MAPNLHTYMMQTNNMTAEPVSRTYQYRKVMKPMLERKRRARINRCLDELKELMTSALQTVSTTLWYFFYLLCQSSWLYFASLLLLFCKHSTNVKLFSFFLIFIGRRKRCKTGKGRYLGADSPPLAYAAPPEPVDHQVRVLLRRPIPGWIPPLCCWGDGLPQRIRCSHQDPPDLTPQQLHSPTGGLSHESRRCALHCSRGPTIPILHIQSSSRPGSGCSLHCTPTTCISLGWTAIAVTFRRTSVTR